MDYYVTGIDGKEYGPIGIETVKQWLSESRITRDSPVHEFHSGRRITVADLPGMAAEAAMPPVSAAYAAPPQPGQYYRPGPTGAVYTQSGEAGMGHFWGAIIRSVLAVILFFVLHGIGLIVGAYALYYAIQCKAHGNRYGTIAIVVAATALIAIGIGWYLRLSGPSAGF